jgi:predicted DNA-binding transcriptional regulator YafY
VGWEALAQATGRGQRVRIEYTGGTQGTKRREVTPRAFVQRGGITYLIAFCHLDLLEKNFRLDRVQWYEVIPDGGDPLSLVDGNRAEDGLLPR